MATRNENSPKPVREADEGRVFEWTGEVGQKVTFVIPQRIKRGKLARCFAQDDFVGALDSMFTAEEMAAFVEIEFSAGEWADLQIKLFDALSDADPKI
ncbi:hypothetical protein [Nonomuraea typhae]|uniref:hypothetical protein n=1 Tax=Nonomuraea typhae TaxID=2603600 RepID=UPI0012FBFFA0|nr:hypothetical protein [Nonomuraea typhae]